MEEGLKKNTIMLLRELEHDFGDVVYFKTDMDQRPRQVHQIIVSKEEFLYELKCGTSISAHFGFELSKDRDINLKLNID